MTVANPWRLAVALCVLAGCLRLAAQVEVLTQHNNQERTGANLKETILKPSNVSSKQFGMLFRRVVDDQVYGQPLYVADLPLNGGTHDVVYVTTVNNSVYAFDANDASAVNPVWHVNFGTPPNVYEGKYGCSDMNGNVGILGTPVIDSVAGTLYVVAATRVGKGYSQRLHALDLATGADRANSPVTITAPGFDPLLQSQRPGLVLSHGTVYVGYGSHCDKQPYHGFLIGYDAQSMQQTGVFNTSPQGQAASIWQFGQAPAVDADGTLYFVTGNGSWNGATDFGESFLKLDDRLKLRDWFTPTDHVHLDAIDADLGTSGAMLVPGTNLILDAGKQGTLYLIDRHGMGHLGDEHAVQHLQVTSSQLPSLVYWSSAQHGPLLYMWGQTDRLKEYQFEGNRLKEAPFATRPEVTEGHPGAMLSLSANGNKDGILWAAIHASGDSWHESRPGILHAYEADDIQHELWNSLQDRTRDDCNNYAKTAPPTIANGKVYFASLGTSNTGSGQLCVYGLLPQGPAPEAPSGLVVSPGAGEASLTWAPTRTLQTYSVRRADKAEFATIASGLTSPHFTDITAGNGSTYRYEVIADDNNGESAASSTANVFLPKPKPATSLLPPGPERELTARVCSGCHSLSLVANERLSAEGWHDVVHSMAARGAVATDAEFQEISAYLAKSFAGPIEQKSK